MLRLTPRSMLPVPLTEEILTEVVTGADCFWSTHPRDGVDDERFTAVENRFVAATGDDDLRLRFYGRAAPYTVDITLGGVTFAESDVAFDRGIVHVVDATVTAAFTVPYRGCGRYRAAGARRRLPRQLRSSASASIGTCASRDSTSTLTFSQANSR